MFKVIIITVILTIIGCVAVTGIILLIMSKRKKARLIAKLKKPYATDTRPKDPLKAGASDARRVINARACALFEGLPADVYKDSWPLYAGSLLVEVRRLLAMPHIRDIETATVKYLELYVLTIIACIRLNRTDVSKEFPISDISTLVDELSRMSNCPEGKVELYRGIAADCAPENTNSDEFVLEEDYQTLRKELLELQNEKIKARVD